MIAANSPSQSITSSRGVARPGHRRRILIFAVIGMLVVLWLQYLRMQKTTAEFARKRNDATVLATEARTLVAGKQTSQFGALPETHENGSVDVLSTLNAAGITKNQLISIVPAPRRPIPDTLLVLCSDRVVLENVSLLPLLQACEALREKDVRIDSLQFRSARGKAGIWDAELTLGYRK